MPNPIFWIMSSVCCPENITGQFTKVYCYCYSLIQWLIPFENNDHSSEKHVCQILFTDEGLLTKVHRSNLSIAFIIAWKLWYVSVLIMGFTSPCKFKHNCQLVSQCEGCECSHSSFRVKRPKPSCVMCMVCTFLYRAETGPAVVSLWY